MTTAKSQEVATGRVLLDRVPSWPGCTVTMDALHTNHETMAKIVDDKEMDFLCQVKNNTPDLQKSLRHALTVHAAERECARTVDVLHGRIEIRCLEMVALLPPETGWPHPHTACRLVREREVLRRGQTVRESQETTLYVGSFGATRYSATEVLLLARGHWGVESLHYRKDRGMDEDRCRAAAKGVGRVLCAFRSVVALMLGRSAESARVVQRRLSCKPVLLLGLLRSHNLGAWEAACQPYRLR